MKTPKSHIIFKALFIAFMAAISFEGYSQNIESIGKKNAFKVNGGLSANQVFYASSDSLSQRDPYNYYLSGNLNFSLYGWSVPLSFNYSNQNVNFSQPFNQYSLHPYYKWVRAHLGYTSMSFSPYTLNGHLFLGGGVELTPPMGLKVKMMGGRMRKAVEFDTTIANALPPEYERWGYGAQVGYNLTKFDFVKADMEFTAFAAKDKASSLGFVPDSMLYPGSNLVLSTRMDFTIKGGFRVGGELASSSVTRNTESDLGASNSKGNFLLDAFHKPNASTSYYNATRLHADYGAKIWSIGLGYERVDPGYNTFGAYYFNNDLENITVNGSVRLLESKLNLAANVGKQRDNLDNSKSSAMDRWVTAFNVGYNSGEKLSLNGSFSTFSSFTHIKSDFDYINETDPTINLDTLDFTQISTNASANANYVLVNTESVRQNISFNLNFQQSAEKQGGQNVNGNSNFYNVSSSYSYSLVPAGLSVSAMVNANLNRSPDMETSTFGPTLAVNKLFFDKKLRTSLASSYNSTANNGETISRVTSLRLNGSYRLGKRHNFTLGLTFMNRHSGLGAEQEERKLNELVGNFNYSMSF